MAAARQSGPCRTTVLFPPPGTVPASSVEVISSFSVFKGDRKIRVGEHCVVVSTDALASRSEYFATMFSGAFKESAEAEEVSLDVPDETCFIHVLYFLMTGTVRDLTLENFAGIVENASFVQSQPLTTYLQQVAVAYHTELFEDPQFRYPRVSSDFMRGFLRAAKAAKKVRVLYEAANLVGSWMGSDIEQGTAMLEYARELFPLPQWNLSLPDESDGLGGKGGKDGKGEAGLTGRARALQQQEQERARAVAVVKHKAKWQFIASHFVRTMRVNPRLLDIFSAKDALRALHSMIDEDFVDRPYQYHHHDDKIRKIRESMQKMRNETKKGLVELLKTAQGLDFTVAAAEDEGDESHASGIQALQSILRTREVFHDHSDYDDGSDRFQGNGSDSSGISY